MIDEERSGLDISDALIFNADYLTYWEKISSRIL